MYKCITCIFKSAVQEIYCISNNEKSLKIHDGTTGTVKKIFPDVFGNGPKDFLSDIIIGQAGRYVAMNDEEFNKKFLVLNLEDMEIFEMKQIGYSNLSLFEAEFTPDEKFLVTQLDYKIPELNNRSSSCIVVWDMEKRQVKHGLFDVAMVKELKGKMSDMDVYNMVHLRDYIYAVGADDCYVRVWNVDSGTLLHRFKAHLNGISDLYTPVTRSQNPTSTFLVTSSDDDAELVFKLYKLDFATGADKETSSECLGICKTTESWRQLSPHQNGNYILIFNEQESLYPYQMQLRDGEEFAVPTDNQTASLQKQFAAFREMEMSLPDTENMKPDPNDPYADDERKYSDDDDDDDEDGSDKTDPDWG